jgi:DNA-binding response OmpR family regulator
VRVLLVERDAALVRVLERSLRSHGFDVSSATSNRDALVLAEDETVGMVVFDVSPFTDDQFGVLQRLRSAHPSLPMLLLVGTEDCVSKLLPVGTDDCLAKPFALEAPIRRIRQRMRASDDDRPTTLVAGDLQLDLLARCGWYGDQLIDLPEREFALLEYFMRHPGRVLSRQSILADVWSYDRDPASNVVDVYVRYLRNRLERVAGRRSMIATVRGAGYRFDGPGPVNRVDHPPAME